MKTEDVKSLVNQYRRQLQKDTANVGDGITVCAYLLLSFCMDAENHDIDLGLTRFQRLAELLPDDAKRIAFNTTPER